MQPPQGTFDTIVVGAGPAGCATAARLAAARPDASVLLVETGPAKSGIRSDVPLGIAALMPFCNARNYAWHTVPQAGLGGRRGYQPRGRGLGATGWAWRDVLPYFLRSEHNTRGADAWHAVGGPLHVSDQASPSACAQAF